MLEVAILTLAFVIFIPGLNNLLLHISPGDLPFIPKKWIQFWRQLLKAGRIW